MGSKFVRYSISLSIQKTKFKTQVNSITDQIGTNEKNYDTQKRVSMMAGMKTGANFWEEDLTSIKILNVHKR